MGRKIVSVIGREAAMAAKASALSLQSLGTCSSFQTEKLLKRFFTKETYFSIRGSWDSNSALTCLTTNFESLSIKGLSEDTTATSSIPDNMASHFDSLLEALKPNRITCSILSPVGHFSCRPMLAPVCLNTPSTLSVHQLKLSEGASG